MQIGQKIIRLSSVDSTNNYAANLLKDGLLEHGTVILADEQFSGRGQRGTKWSAKSGENLTFTFFLKDVNLSVGQQFHLTRIVSLSVVAFLRKNGVHAYVKWPNDIYAGHRKISGILIENQLVGHSLKSSIVGIGLNVNQQNFKGFDAVSLSMITKKKYVLEELMFSFIFALNQTFRSGFYELEDVNRRYHSCLYQLDSPHHYRIGSEKIVGIIRGVTSEGKLILERDSTRYYYDLKEIQL